MQSNLRCWGRLVLLSKQSDLPKEILLEQIEYCIGRSSKNAHIELESALLPRLISRRHATIRRQGAHAYSIEDHNSSNGTFVNNERVYLKPLASGDVVMFPGGRQIKPMQPYVPNIAHGIDITPDTREQFESKLIAAVGKEAIVYRFESLEPPDTLQNPTASNSSGEERLHLGNTSNCIIGQCLPQEMESAPKHCISPPVDSDSMSIINDYNHHPPSTSLEDQQVKENGLSKRQRSDDQPEDSSVKKSRLVSSQNSTSDSLMEPKLHDLVAQVASLKQQVEQLTLEKRALEQALGRPVATLDVSQLHQAFDNEFECAICQDIILSATTMQCSHSFCRSCIREWARNKLECPVCRKRITQRPIRNVALENFVKKYLQTGPIEEIKTHQKRCAELKQREESEIQEFSELATMARSKGTKFLNITDNWSPDERKVFRNGILKYDGKPRKMFCELTGLTIQFIRTAPTEAIRQACANLRIKPAIRNATTVVDFELTRELLQEFYEGDSLFILE